jgi:hypothetical protein
MTSAQLPPLRRRTLLVGAAATALLAACGGSDSGDADGADDSGNGGDGSTAGAAAGTYVVVQRFPQDTQGPGSLRLPISLADADARLLTDGPETLGAQVTDIDGNPIGERITTVRRDLDPNPYYAFRVELDEPGFYSLVVDGGPPEGAAFQVMEPGAIAVAGPGDALPPFDTPTADAAGGVDPICTRQPEPCPFHDVTLAGALAAGTPVVYLIGTPAFCQTGVCAPALESILTLQAPDPGVAFVHAEVYTDDTATISTPAVEAAGLTYEPVVWITDASGTIVERLDAIWNDTELAEVLDRVTA